MGDCYRVMLHIKPRAKLGDIQKRLREFMKARKNVNWNLPEYRRNGVRPDSFEGIIKILLASNQRNIYISEKDYKGFKTYRSSFDATYSWLRILEDAFDYIKYMLEDQSVMSIDHDDGYSLYVVQRDRFGEAFVWERHSHSIEE